MRQEYTNYGTFKVTTEGDCEGRSIRYLGTYTGYIDEIAFALADKCYYSLCFKLANPEKLDMTPKCDSVNITLDINSGTWDMKSDERVSYFKELLKDRDVEVLPGTSYVSCVITRHRETVEEKKEKVLSKLTHEERKLLGLE
ncbi:MAG: hypothetical protein NC416_01210 [Eubacterium sp.]|nr:hypothetical protein [Eubacterium sp.]